MRDKFYDKTALSYHLDYNIIKMMTSLLTAQKIKSGYEKHKGKGADLKRRSAKAETVHGSISSELSFWSDCGKMKASIDLMETRDVENLTQKEILEIFERYSKKVNCVLNFNEGNKKSQFLKIIRPKNQRKN